MGEEYPTKSFKSGNSVAIRLPKELGVEAGQEFVLVKHADRRITVVPAERHKASFLSLAGAMSKSWMAEGRLPSGEDVRRLSASVDPAVDPAA